MHDTTGDAEAFARLITIKARIDGEAGRPIPSDVEQALTRLFGAMHDARDAAACGRPLTALAAEIGAIAMSLAKARGGLDPACLRRDSFRLLRPGDSFRDDSSRYAVVSPRRCLVMGAELRADFALNESTLTQVMPAVRAAVRELALLGASASSIEAAGGRLRAYSSDGRCSSSYDAEVSE